MKRANLQSALLAVGVSASMACQCQPAPESRLTPGDPPTASDSGASVSASQLPASVEDQPVNSYAADFASASRNSHVEVFYRRIGPLARFAALDQMAMIVTVDPGNRYVGVAQPEAYSLWEIGVGKVASGQRLPGHPVQFTDFGVVVNREEKLWAGGRGRYITPAQNDWALRERGGALAYVLSWPARMETPHGPMLSPEVWWGTTADGPGDGRGYAGFTEVIRGRSGCGAVGPDNRIVVAVRGSRFLVLDAFRLAPGSGQEAMRLVDVPLELAVYDMSIVPGGYALLTAPVDVVDTPPRTPVAEMWALRARLLDLEESRTERKLPRFWTSLHLLGPDGRATARADLRFEVYMPPVDAGNGRIYLFGMGFAGIQDGKVMFTTPSPVPMFGTAFADGTMAISAGPELRIIDRDGKILQKLPTQEHEDITTPPAIGPDGSIWVGTEKAVYVARPEGSPTK